MRVQIHTGSACPHRVLRLHRFISPVSACWRNEGIRRRLLSTCCHRSDGATVRFQGLLMSADLGYACACCCCCFWRLVSTVFATGSGSCSLYLLGVWDPSLLWCLSGSLCDYLPPLVCANTQCTVVLGWNTGQFPLASSHDLSLLGFFFFKVTGKETLSGIS